MTKTASSDDDKAREAAIKKQKIEWVFGLTGGELETEPWTYWTQTESEVDGKPLWGPESSIGRVQDWSPGYVSPEARIEHAGAFMEWHGRYWYEGAPEYAESEHGLGSCTTRNIRTLVQPGGMLTAPHRELYDGDGVWKLEATYTSSGEAECPFRGSDDNKTVPGLCPVCGQMVWRVDSTKDGRYVGSCGDAFPQSKWSEDPVNECSLCEEKQGEMHGYIYLGDGGYEAVYVLQTQHTPPDVRVRSMNEGAVKNLLVSILRVLYWDRDDEHEDGWWNPEKYWDEETIEIIGNLVDDYGLRPKED